MNKSIMILSGCLFLLGQSNTHAISERGVAPDVSAGKVRAAVCFSCHTPQGIAKIPGVPHLAGQERSYLEKALKDYRGGQIRQDPTMTSMAKSLTDSDIANIAAYFSLQIPMGNGQNAEEALAMIERIRPVSSVVENSTPAKNESSPIKSGESIYQNTCRACHESGVLGAPKTGDITAWTDRNKQGKEVLVKHAIEGFKAMPPKGGCGNCSDDEIKTAVDYILEKSS